MDGQILVVDDEAHIRLLLEQTLEDLGDQGVEILTAGDGAEALEIIRTRRPALVFLDVMMPDMDGFEVCRIVKHDLGLDDVYVVILTAKGQVVDRQVGEQSGADLYLTKPFDPDHLVSIARRVLEGAS
jgi:two-component system, OmpR family, alkaline phosphatase synthesis response regulator PhoP